MPIDPNIALSVKPPQIADPLEQASRALQVRNQVQQGQAGAIQLQSAQRQLEQSQALDRAYGDALTVGPDGAASVDRGKLTGALATGGHGSAIPGVLKNFNEFDKATADLAKTNAEVAEKRADFGGTIGAMLKDANYDPRVFLLKGGLAVQNKALDPGLVQPYLQQVRQLMDQDPTGESARQRVKEISSQLIAGSPGQQKLINEAKTAAAHEKQATTAESVAPSTIAEKEAQTKLLKTKQPGEEAKAEIERHQADLIKNTKPEDIANLIDIIADPKGKDTATLNLRTHAEADFYLKRGDIAGAKAVVQKAANQIGATEQALATARATAPIKIYTAGASAGAVEPVKEREAGRTQYVKSSEELNQARATATNLQHFIDLARSGNKAAGTNLPLMGVEALNAAQNIKRINGAEIAQYTGAGNLLDRIQGKLGKLVTGQPIPADVLKDIEELHKSVLGSAVGKHNANVKTINGTYNTNFKAEEEPTHAPTARFQVGDSVMYNGAPHKIQAIKPDGKLVLEQ